DVAAALDHDEPGRVRVVVGLGAAALPEGQLGDHAAGIAVDDLALEPDRAGWALRAPVADPEPPNLHDLSSRRPRRRLAPLALPPNGLLTDRGLGPRLARPGEVALPGELVLVCLEQRRVTTEAGIGHREQAAGEDDHDHREVELECRPDDQQEEHDEASPEQPLPHVEIELVAVQGAGPQDVHHDQEAEQDRRRDPERIEEIGEVLGAECDPEVFPGQLLQACPTPLGDRARMEYAMRPGLYSLRPRTGRPRSFSSVSESRMR